LYGTARQSGVGYPYLVLLEVPTTLTRSQFIDYGEEKNKVSFKVGRRTKLARILPDMKKDM
jgi:hypothetical protein